MTPLQNWYVVKLKTLLHRYLSEEIDFVELYGRVANLRKEYQQKLLQLLEKENSNKQSSIREGRFVTFSSLQNWYVVKLKTLLHWYFSEEIDFVELYDRVARLRQEYQEKLVELLEQENQTPNKKPLDRKPCLVAFPTVRSNQPQERI
jgi:hypothetical protein